MIELKHRYSGKTIYRSETAETVKEAVLEAVEKEINLSGSNLSGSNLRGSNLRGSDLRGSDLRGSDLSHSNLSYSDLSYSDLSGSNLRGSDLRGSDLSHSNLSGSNLSGSNLSGSNLSGSNLIDAGQDCRGYRFFGVFDKKSEKLFVRAGCRNFSLSEGKEHWSKAHEDDLPLRAECLAKVALIEAVATARGWLKQAEAAVEATGRCRPAARRLRSRVSD